MLFPFLSSLREAFHRSYWRMSVCPDRFALESTMHHSNIFQWRQITAETFFFKWLRRNKWAAISRSPISHICNLLDLANAHVSHYIHTHTEGERGRGRGGRECVLFHFVPFLEHNGQPLNQVNLFKISSEDPTANGDKLGVFLQHIIAKIILDGKKAENGEGISMNINQQSPNMMTVK